MKYFQPCFYARRNWAWAESQFAGRMQVWNKHASYGKRRQHPMVRAVTWASADAKKTLNDYMQAVQDFAHTSDRAVAAQEKVETTKSDKEGYSNPYALRPGEKPHQTASAVEMVKAAIQAANADSAKALKEIADAVVNGAKQQAAEASRNAQRAKEANNP
jgi:hypothetical protein